MVEKNRVQKKVASYSHLEAQWKGSFVEVLMKPPLRLVGSREVRGVSGGKVLQPSLKSKQQLVHIPKGDGQLSKELLGIGEDISLKAMQEILLNMKTKVEFMLKRVELGIGLGLLGLEVLKNGSVDKLKSVKASGLDFGVGSKKAEDLKGKSKVDGLSLGKSLKRVWRVKARTDISDLSGISVTFSTIPEPNLVPMIPDLA